MRRLERRLSLWLVAIVVSLKSALFIDPQFHPYMFIAGKRASSSARKLKDYLFFRLKTYIDSTKPRSSSIFGGGGMPSHLAHRMGMSRAGTSEPIHH